jgi:hypothetical protein
MTWTATWRGAKAIIIGLGFLAGTTVGNPAHAIFLEADRIESNGSFSTVDLWFFSFNAPANATIQVNYVAGPPIPGGDPDLIIYRDDGTFSTVFAADTAAASDPSIAALFPAGAYIAVVANHPLVPGEFGSFHADSALAAGNHEYEFNGPEPVGGQISLNCVLSGNLDGSFTDRVLAADTCRLPPTSVFEPPTVGLVSMGLIGLAGALRRRTRPNTIQTVGSSSTRE